MLFAQQFVVLDRGPGMIGIDLTVRHSEGKCILGVKIQRSGNLGVIGICPALSAKCSGGKCSDGQFCHAGGK